METSLSLHRKSNRPKLREAARVLAGVFLAFSALLTAAQQLRLPWDLQTAFSGGLSSGLAFAWNRAGDTLGNSDYFLLRRLSDAGSGCGLFLTLVFAVLCAAAYLILKGRFLPMLLVFIVPQALLGILFSLHASTGAVAALALAVIAAAAVIQTDGGLFQGIAGAAAAGIGLLVLFAVLTVSGSGFASLAGKADSGILKESFADAYFGTDPLHHGDLTVRARSTDGKEALSVTMSAPQSMYLKGFTGSRFDGKSWGELTDPTYYGSLDLMRALEAEGFNAPGQLAQTAGFAYDGLENNEIRVRNTGADKRFAYVPYDLTDKGTLADASVKGGSIFYNGKFSRFTDYSYTAAENQVDNWTDAAARFFSMALDQTQKGQTVEDYLRLESHYNGFVYDNYTYLSNADRKILAENIGSPGDQSRGHIDYKKAITGIRSYLEENFIYSENLGAKTTPLTNELGEFFSSHKGFDTHFATAATLMFRYYGIPARYAEGYLITPQDAAALSAGESLSVSRNRAHAWTEIYIDGAGFVPLEVTPEFYGVMDEADMNTGISNEKLIRDFQDQFGNSEENEQEDEKEEKEKKEEPLPIFSILITIAAVAAAAVGLFFLIRMLAALILAWMARRRLFYKAEPKLAVAGIYGYMEEQGLPCSDDVVDLGNRAAYSLQEITEEDRQTMLGAWTAAKKEKKADNGKRPPVRKEEE